jgi:hypothetical protein
MKELFTLKLRTAWSLCLMLVLALSSCDDIQTKDTLVKGVVYDQNSTLPLGGIELKIIEEETRSTPFGSVFYRTVARASSDDNGKYQFLVELDNRARYSYQLVAEYDNRQFLGDNWQEGNYYTAATRMPIEPGTTTLFNVPLVSLGIAEINATNNSVHDSLLFELWTEINGYREREYYRVLNQNESFLSHMEDRIPTGDVLFEWRISNDQMDTTIPYIEEVTNSAVNQFSFTFEG